MSRTVFPALYGNERLKKILGCDIESGKLGHAFILEGSAGSGRHTAALAAAAALSCEKRTSPATSLPCGECLSCRKIARGVSPDVLFVRREDGKATLGVDAIREMRESLWITPNENNHKVYIIENAEAMTPQAQNALLLSLEEPPSYAVFFLLTENADALLATVRSRAPVLRMQRFDGETMAEFLRREKKYKLLESADPTLFCEALTVADGSLGQAMRLLDRSSPDGAEARDAHALAEKFLTEFFHPSAASCAALLTELPKGREDVLEILRLVTLALRDLLALKSGAAVPLMFYLSREESKSLLDRTSQRRIFGAYRDTVAATENLRANASVQSVCTALLTRSAATL